MTVLDNSLMFINFNIHLTLSRVGWTLCTRRDRTCNFFCVTAERLIFNLNNLHYFSNSNYPDSGGYWSGHYRFNIIHIQELEARMNAIERRMNVYNIPNFISISEEKGSFHHQISYFQFNCIILESFRPKIVYNCK